MNAVVTTPSSNPFGAALTAPRVASSNALAGSNQQREIAEVQAAMMIARMNPRDPVAAMDRILNACTRPTLAEKALYVYSRGGSEVSGPSIRLAEAIAQQWGNFNFGIRELEQRNGESTVEAFAWDIETNTRQVKVFQVPHVRHTKKGQTRLSDPRDIYELVANQGARRLRACILGVIPGDVTEAAVQQAETTMATRVEVTPEMIAKLVEAFDEYDVTKEHIEKRIQRRVESILPAQVLSLRKIFNSLRDGMSAPHEWFEIEPPAPAMPEAVAAVNERISAKSKPPVRDLDAEQSAGLDAAMASNEVEKPEVRADNGAPTVSYAQLMDMINRAQTLDDLAVAGDLIQYLPPDQQQDVSDAYGRRYKQLKREG